MDYTHNAIFYISQMASRQLHELEEDERRQFIKRGCGCAIKCPSFFPLEKIQKQHSRDGASTKRYGHS